MSGASSIRIRDQLTYVFPRTMHRVRQAKLSFPSVYLLVGPFTDAQCRAHSLPCTLLHVERAEALRHVRWVDEIVSEAPVELSDAFLKQHRVDYVAIEEGSSVDPAISKAQLVGYDRVKGLGAWFMSSNTSRSDLYCFFQVRQ